MSESIVIKLPLPVPSTLGEILGWLPIAQIIKHSIFLTILQPNSAREH